MSLSALKLAWKLEERGCSIRVAKDGVGLVVGPRKLLTDADDADIRRYRDELLALCRYLETIL